PLRRAMRLETFGRGSGTVGRRCHNISDGAAENCASPGKAEDTFMTKFPRQLIFSVLSLCVVLGASRSATAQDAPTIPTHHRWVTAAAFSPDGAKLATVGGESLLYRPGDVLLWDPKTGAHLAAFSG